MFEKESQDCSVLKLSAEAYYRLGNPYVKLSKYKEVPCSEALLKIFR